MLAHSLAGQQRPRAGNMDRMESGDDGELRNTLYTLLALAFCKSAALHLLH